MADTIRDDVTDLLIMSADRLFSAPGDVCARARVHDWAATPLGSVDTWSVAFRTAVRLMMESPISMCLYAGPSYITLYNDAYRSALGAKHPAALGCAASDVWHELWPELALQFAQVRDNGRALHLQHVPFSIERLEGGGREQAWFDYTLSPVRDETNETEPGTVIAILSVVSETTSRTHGERELALEKKRLRALIQRMPTPVALHMGPDHRYQIVSESFRRISGGRDITGMTPREAYPEVEGQGVLERFDEVFATGIPWGDHELYLRLDRSGTGVEDSWFDVRYEPVHDAEGSVVGILNFSFDITEQVRARHEVERVLAQTEKARAEAEAAATRTAGLQAATASLAAATSFEEVATAVDGAARTLGAAGALVYRLGEKRLGEDPAVLYNAIAESVGAFGPDVARAWQVVTLETDAAIAETIRIRTAIFHATPAERAAKYPHLMSQSMSTRFGSWASLPLVVEGRAVGSLTIAWRAPQTNELFTDADRALAVALADQCAVSVERVRLHAAERAALERAETAATELLVMEARLRFAMDVADVGAWDLDLTGGAAWRALRHDQIFGYPNGRAEWTYNDFLSHVHPEDHDWVDEAFSGAVANNGAWAFTCRIRQAGDGAERWVAVRGEVVTAPDGRPERMVGVVRDVTEQQLAEHTLREARDAAEAANRAKSEFLAIMSHELRTPLNAIDGYAELMELGIRGPITADQRQDLARIRKSEKHLLGLINGVLNYAQVEAGAVHYDLEAVPLDEVLTNCEALTGPQVRANSLTLHREPCDPSILVWADREKLQQVILNLLSNAIKFTDSGGQIHVRWAHVSHGDDSTVSVEVTDTGIGIAANQLTRIFEPFVQVDTELTRTREGTGLGLAISRNLARGMGGELVAISEIGRGSTFTLTLPRA